MTMIEDLFCGNTQAKLKDTKLDLDVANVSLLQCKNTNTALSMQVNDLDRQYGELKLAAQQTGSKQLVQIGKLTEQVSQLNQTVEAQSESIINLTAQASLQTSFTLLPKLSQQAALVYYGKYPTANITYSGRSIGTLKTRYELDVRAWCLEGQNDARVLNVLKGNNVMDTLTLHPELSFHQACDRCIMVLKNRLDGMVRYQYDVATWGENEFWQFASETIDLGMGDCEDKAILNYVAWRAAGIPKELLRVTAGMTFSGDGHCTNFYLASDLKFHHLNSTTNYSALQDPKALPLTGDSNEQLNIRYPWFSMTEEKSFSSFGTAEAQASYLQMAEDTFRKYIKIGGMRK